MYMVTVYIVTTQGDNKRALICIQTGAANRDTNAYTNKDTTRCAKGGAYINKTKTKQKENKEPKDARESCLKEGWREEGKRRYTIF